MTPCSQDVQECHGVAGSVHAWYVYLILVHSRASRPICPWSLLCAFDAETISASSVCCLSAALKPSSSWQPCQRQTG